MARAVDEWVGKTPDTKVPDRVRLRIFQREGGKCWISGRKIQAGDAWDLDHKVALINGGQHAESNLFPALRDKHREKTAADVAEKARIAKLAKRAAGIRKEPHPRFRKPAGAVFDWSRGRYVKGPEA